MKTSWWAYTQDEPLNLWWRLKWKRNNEKNDKERKSEVTLQLAMENQNQCGGKTQATPKNKKVMCLEKIFLNTNRGCNCAWK